jgi:hypothetical protein
MMDVDGIRQDRESSIAVEKYVYCTFLMSFFSVELGGHESLLYYSHTA